MAVQTYRWGIVIDEDRCTGCAACVIACHAENNIQVVGDDQTSKGRQINWIRVERYWEGEYPDVKARFRPVLCQQCANAPCEPVCPVYATYHNPDGLNTQIYNRCVGVRYCANNCPYRVRFFNWFEPSWPEPLTQQLNPGLTVRKKGLIEKCTFCIQRIRDAKETANLEGRRVRDGEVQPACVQTCPPKALVFGDLSDPNSEVSRLAKSNRGYQLLADIGTQPVVIYLKEL
jgi:Fe-S-cluster-containing dehydrogenase component